MSEPWKPWETEAAMVADFTLWVLAQGIGNPNRPTDPWTVYAETGGWDLVLVRQSDGFQIGVEAKLKLNALVLAQAIGHDRYDRGLGPDCIAILAPAPKVVNGVEALARALGVAVIMAGPPVSRDPWHAEQMERMGRKLPPPCPRFGPELPYTCRFRETWERDWPERAPDQRIVLPDYVPDVTGGHSAPVKLTPWKVGALKVTAVLERRGWVTRKDIKALGIDPGRWTQERWLHSLGEGRWEIGRNMPAFKAQHPVNYAQIMADMPKWLPASIHLDASSPPVVTAESSQPGPPPESLELAFGPIHR